MSDYIRKTVLEPTPQNEPISGREEEMTQNRAGGYSFSITPLQQLERWLVLGSEGSTYYASEREMTLSNVSALKECLRRANTGIAAVDTIAKFSTEGRIPKVQTAIFALAVAASSDIPWVRSRALDYLPHVCRTGSHLLEFVSYIDEMRGWGRQLKKAIADWYKHWISEGGVGPLKRDRDSVQWAAYQIAKYYNRNKWTHRDVLRMAHVKAESDKELNTLFKWTVDQTTKIDATETPSLMILEGFQKIREEGLTVEEVAKIVGDYGLTHEMIPSEFKSEPAVQAVLLDGMPMTAMIRNLASYTKSGLLYPLSEATNQVVRALDSEKKLHASRVHPVQLLMAMRTYAAGHGVKGSASWTPVAQITAALERAYYKSFKNVEPTGKNFYLALDVSGSMTQGGVAGIHDFSPREASACMALVTAKTESSYYIAGFTGELVPLSITSADSLKSAIRTVSDLPFGRTDCAQPMIDAADKKIPVDCFVVYTDSETWAGRIHPHIALERYRQMMGRDATLVVVGMIANEYSIADPNDPRELDVVGFDTNVPKLISDMALSV